MTVYNLPTSDDVHFYRTAIAVKQLAQGRSNGVGSFTLTASAATTAVSAEYCATGSMIVYSPTTANASAEIGAGTIYISSVGNKTFTVTHANNAQTDRTFQFIALG